MSEMKHGEGELRCQFSLVANSHGPGYLLFVDDGIIGTTPGGTELDAANAARIVTAWNCHDDLVSVVRELIECADYWSEYDVPLGIVDRMKAAIAKVGRT